MVRCKMVRILQTGSRSWRRTVVATVALPLVISLAVLAYAWPASRIAPRDLPVGVVGTNPAVQKAVEGLTHSKPDAFDLRLYPDQESARSAIRNREVYGAFVVTAGKVTVLEAGAASPSVAQILTTTGRQLAARAEQLHARVATPAAGASHRSTAGGSPARSAPKVGFQAVDVVPTSADDPRGVVFSSALLPLTICSVLIAALVALTGVRTSVRRRLLDLLAACAAAGLAAYLITQGVLGALPHEHAATWGALSLTLLAISSTSVGLISLLGPAGLGLGAALMVFVGNPFSGGTSAPELLPKVVDDIGQWLPPGAGMSLLRSTAYFDGNGSEGHLAVLVLWSALGLTAAVFGRRTPDATAATPEDVPATEGTSQESPATARPATTPSPSPADRPHGRHTAHTAHT
ncbi:ABC transporter permease [Streptomyces sp. NPDC048489]|uniref:ABC transporter permease n=1 Tax=Streptomyces sp. NPDC048489 TaxID=3154504 RepID=UPI00341C16E4